MRKAVGVLTLLAWLIVGISCQEESGHADRAMDSVTIGNQTWATSNLDVGHFRNGDPIFEANSYEKWEEASIQGIPAWCYYDNDPANGEKFGRIYNYWAVSDPRELAPEGWHIPTGKEWEELAEALGGSAVAGFTLKSNNAWMESGNGSNESGFSGYPGGYRAHDGPGFMWGPFYGKAQETYWWSTTGYLVDNVWGFKLSYQNNELGKDSFVKTSGLYVRLIKDHNKE